MLSVENLHVRYGLVPAVRGISFTVEPGSILTIVGPNGAGKSSTLLALAGAHDASRAARVAVEGSVRLDDKELLGLRADAVVRQGISLVPERRRIFAALTVAENLVVARASRRDRREAERDVRDLMERFPDLERFSDRPASFLSGGQQQQLALARALVTKPRVLLLDEPSLGLAPIVTQSAFEIIEQLRGEGLAIVLIEQDALRAVEIADKTLLMRNGTVSAMDGSQDEKRMVAAYFGVDSIETVPAR